MLVISLTVTGDRLNIAPVQKASGGGELGPSMLARFGAFYY